MPNIAYGDLRSNKNPVDWKSVNYDYDYPLDLDLKPGTEFHDKLVDKVMKRARESANLIGTRHPAWNNIDRVLTAYALTDDDEKDIVEEDSRKPVTIVFPYSYALLETILSYMVAAFLQDPIFRYVGSSPEDTIGAIQLEKVIAHHCYRSKVGLALHTFFRDCFSYGFGVAAPGWRVERGIQYKKQPFLNRMFGGEDRYPEEAILFEGNELLNIDPYYSLPDPNVPIHDVQRGEFFGWLEEDNYLDMLSEEKESEELFNVKYLKHLMRRKTSLYSEDASAREEKVAGPYKSRDSELTTGVDKINMFVKLIPEEWGLGDEEYPEKWKFTVVADEVLVEARPVDLSHNRFPIATAAPDFDGYSTTPISRLEILYGLQHILDWLFNSHIANVRKAVNDMLVVDPYIVNVNDLKDPKPGKIIRTRRPVWGKGVKDAVQQLAVNDITRANISDGAFIMEYMQKVAAADDASMGHLRRGGPERLTGAEFEGTRQGAFSRLERVARVIGLQGMQDIGYFFAAHTQQLMSEEVYVNTTGEWQKRLEQEFGRSKDNRMKVTPYDLLVNYDITVRDGSVPGNNFSRIWIDMFKIVADHPELQNKFDIVRIFKHIARNSGAKNVEEFEREPTTAAVIPDQQIINAAQTGDLRPIRGGQAL